MADQCEAKYDRVIEHGDGVTTEQQVRCTYIKGHPDPRHSWETLKVQDECDRVVNTPVESIPEDVLAIVGWMASGAADQWLELLLKTGHDRKRAKRGERGF